jgi:heat shock protein HslJ
MRPGPALIALAITGCAPVQTGIPPRAASVDGEWQVLVVKRQVMPAAPEFRMRFVSGRLSARFGCNFMGATYHQAGVVLHVGPLTSTRMACTGPGAMIEQDAGLILAQPLSISWTSPSTLELNNRAGGIKLARVR